MKRFPKGYQWLRKQLWNVFRCHKMLAMYMRYFNKKPEAIEYGRTRFVFIFRNYVVKLPMTLNGLTDNDWEGSVSNANDDPDEIRYARTRLVYVGEIPILFMERVAWADEDEIKTLMGYCPRWLSFVDCAQVGFNKRGQLVAFDYGLT